LRRDAILEAPGVNKRAAIKRMTIYGRFKNFLKTKQRSVQIFVATTGGL
jgi:hypothetical protein